jgi:hypothetical protein
MTQVLSTTAGDTPAVIVLGTDVLLAARPATPVQLAHACLAAGYRAAFPASWGDELLAASFATRAAARADEPLIACTCPFVAERFAGSELDGFLLALTSPPVAAARYLRELYGHVVHITYVGACPSASDASIDVRYAPGEFLARLRELGIEVEEQPVVFESVIPPDRRRFDSLPGGVPTTEALRRAGATQKLIELDGDDFVVALAEQLLTREAAFIDVAPRLGCACAGATSAGSLRPAIAALEPPRARAAVIDAAVPVSLDPPPPTLGIEPPAPHQVESLETPAAPPVPLGEPSPTPAPATATADVETAVPEAEMTPPLRPVPVLHAEPVELAASTTGAPIETAAVPEVPTQPTAPEPAPSSPAPLPDERASRRSPAFGVPRLGVATPVSRTTEGRIVPRAYLRRRRPAMEEPRVEEHAPAADRQAAIATHVEPEAIQPPAAETPAVEPTTPTRPIEVEVPLPRATIPSLTATDVIPPPPIMPDVHFGESLIVADSLSELIGMEAATTQPLVPSEATPPPMPMTSASEPPAPSETRQASTVVAPEDMPPAAAIIAVPAAVAPAEEEVRAPAPPQPVELPPPPPAAARRPPAPATPIVPPAMPALRGPGPQGIPPLPRATPAMAPRMTRRERSGVPLPVRRRGTAAVLWALVVATLALGVLGTRLLITNALAWAATGRPDSVATPAAAEPLETPVLSPVVIDSLAPLPDSAAAPAAPAADSSAAGMPPAVDSSLRRAAPSPAPATDTARPARRAEPPRAPPRAPARAPVAPKPTRSGAGASATHRQRVRAAVPPHIAIVKDSATNDTGTAADSAARDSLPEPPKLSEPRVTRPWPPPAQR